MEIQYSRKTKLIETAYRLGEFFTTKIQHLLVTSQLHDWDKVTTSQK
jgi:hypothetical protein